MSALQRFGRWLAGPIPVSVVLALLIGACFMLIAGVDPLSGYAAMLNGSFGSGPGLANTLQRAIPIIGIGIAIAIAFRAGVLNLGTEGQAGLGALAGGIVAIYVPGPAALILLLAIVTAIAVGAAWGLIAAVLQNLLGVPILLSTLLLNYPARYFSSWLIRFRLDEPTSDLVASAQIRPEVQLSMLVGRDSTLADTLRGTLGPTHPLTAVLTSVNWSLVVLVVILVAVVFMNRRTRYGFESGLSGQNAEFVRYGGVKPGPLVLRTMTLSGGIAGLFGLLLTVGAPNTRLIEGYFVQTNYAWTALLVTLLALYRPVGIVIAGLFFAAIMVGSDALGRELGLSPQIAAVIQALVIILLAFRVAWPRFRRRGRGAAGVAEAEPPLDEPPVEHSPLTAAHAPEPLGAGVTDPASATAAEPKESGR
ncbi:ABC transporter permease [Leucobacter massiliensis]|uniref:ABC transporter permease n=1 Tax=Leucobacter massiliensis TaxID=1686285 RepID=A0A2S9QSK7_9MICO|nr:ABC transporter permease [Leucobacter massiliensis]PRI12552.1 ABC transporter permease [Leucobacter massiliensis]PRI12579.1 ABC transporter permease [Leucobacter massiliensis]